MARFKYMGEPSRPDLVVGYGECLSVRTNCKDPDCDEVYDPQSPDDHFPIDEDMGHEITCLRCLRILRADTRFQEIV